MDIIKQIRAGNFTDPSTLSGALVYAIVFSFVAWLIGRALRLAVHRLLEGDQEHHRDRAAVRFLAQLVRYGVYLFAFISYAHLVPALSRLGTAWLASVGVISVVVGLAAQN